MDLRFNYEKIRDEINRADFGYIDSESALAKDVKRRLHEHIDMILDLEKEKQQIDSLIQEQRAVLKKEAEKWGI